MEDENMHMIIAPSDPSTYKYTDNEWVDIYKRGEKDGFTAEEIMESSRRNGCWSFFTPDIYVSNKIKKEDDILNDGWRN